MQSCYRDDTLLYSAKEIQNQIIVFLTNTVEIKIQPSKRE